MLSDDQDWRLVADLGDDEDARRLAEQLTEGTARQDVGHDVVVTHKKARLCAYAATREGIDRVRLLVEDDLAGRAGPARIELRHRGSTSEEWQDPETAGVDEPRGELGSDTELRERAIVCVAGNLGRDAYERDIFGLVSRAR